MIARVRRLGVEEGLLAVFVLLAVAAFVRTRPEAWAWLALLPVVAATAFRLVRVPPPVPRVVEGATWLALAAVAAVVLDWLVSPAGQGQPAPPLPAAAGFGLATLAAILLAGRALWPPARAALPAALGLLVLAASQNSRPMRSAASLAALGAVALLAAPRDAGPGTSTLSRALRLAPFVAAAAGAGAAIAWFLPWFQPKVIHAAARAAFPEAETGFSLETRLGDVDELRLSPRVVLRVWTERPQKLRGAVGTRFDGRSWRAEEEAPPEPLVAAASSPELALASLLAGVPGATFRTPGRERSGPFVATRVVQAAPLEGALVAPVGVVLVRAPLERMIVDAAGILSPSAESGQAYGTLNRPGPDGAEAPSPALLEVPAETDPRVRELAGRLAAGATTAESRVARTVAFLQSEYGYTLRMGRFRSAQPVAEFLFEKKQGWCQYFASAAALLLRLQGVPARLVSGFLVRPGLRRGGHYVVREADAHAWVEAWLPGQGWVEADPTPAAGYEAAHGRPDVGRWAEAWEFLKGALARAWAAEWGGVPGLLWDELRAALRAPAARGAALLGVASMLVLVSLLARRRARARRTTLADPAGGGPPELARLLARLDRAWARRGLPRPPSRAPLEHLRASAGRVSPRLGEAIRRAVDAYYASRFGASAAEPAALAALEAELARAEGDATSRLARPEC